MPHHAAGVDRVAIFLDGHARLERGLTALLDAAESSVAAAKPRRSQKR